MPTIKGPITLNAKNMRKVLKKHHHGIVPANVGHWVQTKKGGK